MFRFVSAPDDVQTSRRVVAAAVVGTMLEAYDFSVYGFLLIPISHAFFPTRNGLVALLAAAAVFGAGFTMRPLGAFVLGGFADREGRRAGLALSLTLMAVGTATIALTPNYMLLGVAAPVLVVVGRLLQGFSAGGEFAGAAALLVEHAPAGLRGRFGALQQVSQGLALLLGSLVTASMSVVLTKSDMSAWGWRIPFLLGVLVLPIGLRLRAALPPPPVVTGAAFTAHPIVEAIRRHRGAMAKAAGLTTAGSVCVYVLLLYMPTYAVRELGEPPTTAMLVSVLSTAAYAASCGAAGAWSDRVGRRAPMLIGLLGLLALTWAAFILITAKPNLPELAVLDAALGALLGLYGGPAIALVAELFPARVRASGFSIGFTAAVVLFGGFAPFVLTWLIAITGSKLAPAAYVSCALLITLVALASVDPEELHNDAPLPS